MGAKNKGYIMPRNPKELSKYDNNGGPAGRRSQQTFMSPEDVAAGKKSMWTEMEITGTIRNLSPNLFKLTNLTALHLKNNLLYRLPAEISGLTNLRLLDLSNNKLRSLPAEIGDLVNLSVSPIKLSQRFKTYNPMYLPVVQTFLLLRYPRVMTAMVVLSFLHSLELLLSHNNLRILPYELGKLFNLMVLGLQGNPLNKDILNIYSEPNGTQKLLTYMLDNLQGKCLYEI